MYLSICSLSVANPLDMFLRSVRKGGGKTGRSRPQGKTQTGEGGTVTGGPGGSRRCDGTGFQKEITHVHAIHHAIIGVHKRKLDYMCYTIT